VKVTAEKIPASKVLLKIEIPPDEVERAIEKTYRDLSQRVRVPGFRPGKAPRNLVERYLGGPESVQREGVDRLIDDSFRRALRDEDIHPIGDPDITERPDFHPGEPIVYEATVPVAPTVVLGDYQSIRMQPVLVEATPDQVNKFIDDLREANATWEPVDRGAKDHDQVVVDVHGIAGTVPTLYGPGGEALLQTEGGTEVFNETAHEHSIDVQGPVEFAPGFDEELIGLTAGSEKRFGLTLPADFRDASLANQSIVFSVKVHKVSEKHLPTIDDELAKAVGGGETLEELRESVRQRLQARLEREARTLYENALVEAVSNRSTIELPDLLVERQIDGQIEDLKADLSRERMTWQDYLAATKSTETQVREQLRESATNTLRRYLILREVARREGIHVSPAEVNVEIDATAAQFGRARNAVRERLSTREQRERIQDRIFYGRAVARLAEIAQQPPLGPETAAAEVSGAPTEAAASEPAAPAPVESEDGGSTQPAGTEASASAEGART
jgi:trigger factor